ncbi:ferredoxin [Streptomyces sp. NPDC058579]|uniref:ferredoxin n=1 Tax=Streptomyces sp. NPDC058579 TaxID=3346548 RepID=UPI00364EFA86
MSLANRLRVDVSEDRCIGAGHCVMSAPSVFDQRIEDGIVALLDPTPSSDQHGSVAEAADLCPSAAIDVRVHQRTERQAGGCYS